MASLQETIWENISSQPLKANLAGKYYRLTEWPNFGFSRYSPDFIVLSANLTRKSMNKKELSQLLKTDENIINHFLNASSLLNILETMDHKDGEVTDKKLSVSKFTEKLKSIFKFK